MVYGTEYEYEGKTYTIVWGYEHKNNANGAAGRARTFWMLSMPIPT